MEIPRIAWLFLLFSGATYLIIPSSVFDINVLDVRLPTAFVFFLIAMLRWRIDTAIAAGIFNGVIAAVLAVRVFGVAEVWQAYSKIVSDYEVSFTQIEPGSRILVASDLTSGWLNLGMDRYWLRPTRPSGWQLRWPGAAILHLPTLAAIERSCLVSTVFADPANKSYGILRVTAPYRGAIPTDLVQLTEGRLASLDGSFPPDGPSSGASPQEEHLKDWRDHYDYLYVQFAPPGSDLHLADVTLLYQGRSFQLYKVMTLP